MDMQTFWDGVVSDISELRAIAHHAPHLPLQLTGAIASCRAVKQLVAVMDGST